jgi:pimeloyl-ACP methyl ester carboxylesterase
VDEAGYDCFPLLGVSQGCAISIAYAARHPERVSQLILYAGFSAGAYARNEDPAEIERRRAMGTLMRLGWGQPNPAFRQLFTSMFIPGASLDQAEAFNELQRRTTSPECAARYYEASAKLDVRHLLGEVKCPTLVMHPSGDANVSVELGRRMAAGIPGARFVPLCGQNHLFLEGEPAEARFFEEMRHFLNAPS